MSGKRESVRGGIRRNRAQSEITARVQQTMPVAKLKPNDQQARTRFDEESLKELAASIEQYGMINPIVVDRGGMIVAGERRFRAAQLAGWTTVPVYVLPQNRVDQRREISLIENIQRQDLHPLEEAYAIKDILEETGMTQTELGDRLGKQKDYLSKTLSLLSLARDIQDEWVARGQLASKSLMIQLSRLDEGEQRRRWSTIKRSADGEKPAKAQRKEPPHRAPQPRSVIANAEKFRDLIERADPTGWKATTRGTLRAELLQVRSVIDEKLKALEESG